MYSSSSSSSLVPLVPPGPTAPAPPGGTTRSGSAAGGPLQPLQLRVLVAVLRFSLASVLHSCFLLLIGSFSLLTFLLYPLSHSVSNHLIYSPILLYLSRFTVSSLIFFPSLLPPLSRRPLLPLPSPPRVLRMFPKANVKCPPTGVSVQVMHAIFLADKKIKRPKQRSDGVPCW